MHLRLTFQSLSRTVKDSDGKTKYRNTTYFFRDDLNWKLMGNYLAAKYQNADKVNFICYACSDGSEPMSAAIMLREKFGDNAGKFLPLIAKDIDETMIKNASDSRVMIDRYDIDNIKEFTAGSVEKYFDIPSFPEGDCSVSARPKSFLQGAITFRTADITKDIENIPQKNTVLFCRNFGPYIKPPVERHTLARNLAERLNENCIVVIGDYDGMVSTYTLLEKNGFRRVRHLRNVFENVNPGGLFPKIDLLAKKIHL